VINGHGKALIKQNGFKDISIRIANKEGKCKRRKYDKVGLMSQEVRIMRY
jgi:hypothetical protein